MNGNRIIVKESDMLNEDLKHLKVEKEALEEALYDLEIKLEKSKVEITDLLETNKKETNVCV